MPDLGMLVVLACGRTFCNLLPMFIFYYWDVTRNSHRPSELRRLYASRQLTQYAAKYSFGFLFMSSWGDNLYQLLAAHNLKSANVIWIEPKLGLFDEFSVIRKWMLAKMQTAIRNGSYHYNYHFWRQWPLPQPIDYLGCDAIILRTGLHDCMWENLNV